ncbi:MAG: NAD(P)-binding protein, partial [Muribaculaceae bacterium]|nr:NAD(P)-binding protein [Muribaculaceae bacterium]
MKECRSNKDETDKRRLAVIAGAGPAGLTAAYELASSGKVTPVVFEESGKIGGISRTELYKGNRIDIGGHRFFSKSDRVTRWWNRVMPLEGNPEETDLAMLRRRRVSRIYYLRRFFDYPVRMSFQTIRNLGLARTAAAGFSYLKSAVVKRPEVSLEDFYINRFGKTLYRMFFEDYTEKVWG